MRELPRSQQPDNQELVSSTFGRRIIGLARLGSTFHPAWLDQCLPSNEDQERRWMVDGLQDPLWLFWIPGYAFWIDQRTGHVSGLYQPDPSSEAWRFRDSISWWHSHLHWEQKQRARPSRPVGARPTAEAFIVHQLQEMPFSSRWGEILRLYCLPSRHSNGRWTHKSRTWLT